MNHGVQAGVEIALQREPALLQALDQVPPQPSALLVDEVGNPLVDLLEQAPAGDAAREQPGHVGKQRLEDGGHLEERVHEPGLRGDAGRRVHRGEANLEQLPAQLNGSLDQSVGLPDEPRGGRPE